MRVFIALLIVVGAASSARAGKERARELFKQANLHYNLAEYDDALKDFKAAYREHADPSFLYNLAQCERLLGDKPAAVHFYKTYLSQMPSAPNAEPVRQSIAALEKAIADEEAAARAAAAATAEAAAARATVAVVKPLPAAPPAVPSSRRMALVAGISLTFATLVSGAVAAGLLVHASDLNTQAQAPHPPPNTSTIDLHRSASNYSAAGYALLGLGGAAAIGTVIAFVFYGRAPKAAVITALPLAGGALATVGGHF